MKAFWIGPLRPVPPIVTDIHRIEMTTQTPFIPPSTGSTVDVSIILGGRTSVPCAWLFRDTIPGHDILDVPCYNFLIEHNKSGKKILYDLGLMKAWKEKQPPASEYPFLDACRSPVEDRRR